MCLNTRVRPCVRHVSDMTRNIHSTCPTRMGVQPQHGPGRDIPAGVDACELPPAGWAGSPHAMCAVCQWAGLRLVAAGGTPRLVALRGWWHSAAGGTLRLVALCGWWHSGGTLASSWGQWFRYPTTWPAPGSCPRVVPWEAASAARQVNPAGRVGVSAPLPWPRLRPRRGGDPGLPQVMTWGESISAFDHQGAMGGSVRIRPHWCT
jgi:hypothetical protein